MDRSYGFTLAIKYFGNLKQLRLRTGIKHGKIQYMRNHSKNINLIDALKIELASQGNIKWYFFMENIDEKIKQRIEKGTSFISNNKKNSPDRLSQRICAAIEYEKQLGSRRGQRTDCKRLIIPSF